MAGYNIGQHVLNKNNMITYVSGNLNPVKINTFKKNKTMGDPFMDPFYTGSGENIGFSANVHYFIRFRVMQKLDPQVIKIKLESDNVEEGVPAEEKTYTEEITEIVVNSLPSGIKETSQDFEITFVPDQSYQRLVFELSRNANDFKGVDENSITGWQDQKQNAQSEKWNGEDIFYDETQTNETDEGNIGRLCRVSIEEGFQVENFLPLVVPIYKLGIQANPGMKFMIDNEEIIIGKSGFFELYHDNIVVDYVGYIPRSSDDEFIVDYKY